VSVTPPSDVSGASTNKGVTQSPGHWASFRRSYSYPRGRARCRRACESFGWWGSEQGGHGVPVLRKRVSTYQRATLRLPMLQRRWEFFESLALTVTIGLLWHSRTMSPIGLFFVVFAFVLLPRLSSLLCRFAGSVLVLIAAWNVDASGVNVESIWLLTAGIVVWSLGHLRWFFHRGYWRSPLLGWFHRHVSTFG